MLYKLFRHSVSIMDPQPVARSGAALTSLGPSIWCADRTIKFHFGISLPLRMVVVANENCELLLYSPVALDDETRAALDALGPVRWIIRPNPLHGHFIGAYRRTYPDAIYVTPRQTASERWQPWMETTLVTTRNEYAEICCYHPASHTLILSDLAFNVRRGGVGTQYLLRFNGAWQRFGTTRVQRLLVLNNDFALRTFCRWALNRNFTQISVSHGELVTDNAVLAFKQAFGQWLPS